MQQRDLNGDPPARRSGDYTPHEIQYYLLGRVLDIKLELLVEDAMKESPDEADGSAGPNPGQGTATEKELWNDPSKMDEIRSVQ